MTSVPLSCAPLLRDDAGGAQREGKEESSAYTS